MKADWGKWETKNSVTNQPTEGYKGSSEKLLFDITWKREEEKEEIHYKQTVSNWQLFKAENEMEMYRKVNAFFSISVFHWTYFSLDS